jgi:hypothetical protein
MLWSLNKHAAERKLQGPKCRFAVIARIARIARRNIAGHNIPQSIWLPSEKLQREIAAVGRPRTAFGSPLTVFATEPPLPTANLVTGSTVGYRPVAIR